MSAELSHLDDSGRVRMVDVGDKPLERRRATARAVVSMARESSIKLRELPKGDALACAEVAGIMAAKRTSELIPLCHPLPLTHVHVRAEVVEGGVEIEAVVETMARTGVEMEALTAAGVAALTLYDMVKGVDRDLVIEQITLVEKTKEPVS
jgi:cyclic pyranopterin phosphate synthase